MKTMKLAMVAMGLMAGMLTAGTAMAQGGYYYDDGFGGGGMVVNNGCGDPNCRNCGGGVNSGGTVIYVGGRELRDNRVMSGGREFYSPAAGGRPMSSGSAWQVEQERIRQERMGVRVQDPGIAMVGGILSGIGGALNNDRAKNGAAGDILNGIGNGFILGAQPEVYYDSRELYREQGNVINWGR